MTIRWLRWPEGSGWRQKMMGLFIMTALVFLMTSCGFHLQGMLNLAPPLQRLYLETADPYGQLSRSLQQYLRMSNVELVSSPVQATTILHIMHDDIARSLINVSSSQQTRQYNLIVTVTYEITNNRGQVLLGPEVMTETRALTVQSDQELGSSNEANLFYQQMRRTLAYSIMNRIASRQVTNVVNHAFNLSKNGCP